MYMFIVYHVDVVTALTRNTQKYRLAHFMAMVLTFKTENGGLFKAG